MEFKRSKKEPSIIKCSAHKSNSKIKVIFGFYIFSGLFEYVKGASKIN